MTDIYSNLLVKVAAYDPSAVLLYKIAAGGAAAGKAVSKPLKTMVQLALEKGGPAVTKEVAQETAKKGAPVAGRSVSAKARAFVAKLAGKDVENAVQTAGKKKLFSSKELGQQRGGFLNFTTRGSGKTPAAKVPSGKPPVKTLSVAGGGTAAAAGSGSSKDKTLSVKPQDLPKSPVLTPDKGGKPTVPAKAPSSAAATKEVAAKGTGKFMDIMKSPWTWGTAAAAAGAGGLTTQIAMLKRTLEDGAAAGGKFPAGLAAGAAAMPIIYGGLSLIPGMKKKRITKAIISLLGSAATGAAVHNAQNNIA